MITYFYFCDDYGKSLDGVWLGEKSFLETADLDILFLYINEDVGYLFMRSDDEIIFNKPIEIKYNRRALNGVNKTNVKIPVKFITKKIPWPKEVIFETNMFDNSLKIYNKEDNTLYAFLHKEVI
ncbi:MAG: hypothetical protein KAS12_01660 [Candidatus Aenigmarchaeota archaeon]|nr:hypothetical protein [Candidatus Aenigmarchaeota archaeon]